MDLTTERLALRKLTKNDYEAIHEYSREKNVGPNAGWKPHESMNETIQIANLIFIDRDTIWGIVLKENEKLIGSVGLVDDPKRENDKTKMIGYSMSEKYWGQGIMTEAVKEVIRHGFEDLKLDLISAYCYPFNKRSKRVLEKCSFEYEGTLKKAEKMYDGNIYDNECYAIERKMYEKNN